MLCGAIDKMEGNTGTVNVDGMVYPLDMFEDDEVGDYFEYMVSDQSSVCQPCTDLVPVLKKMTKYIQEHNQTEGFQMPVTLFPVRLMNYFGQKGMKSAVRAYRLQDARYCKCSKPAALHHGTGKCATMIIALSFAYHTSNMMNRCPDHDDIITAMELNYQNYKSFVETRNRTASKTNMELKVIRYDKVLTHNRRMYTPPIPEEEYEEDSDSDSD